MDELKTEVTYEIRSLEYHNQSGEPVTFRRGPYRTLGHAKTALRYKSWMADPKIVKITRTFTEVEEVVEL